MTRYKPNRQGIIEVMRGPRVQTMVNSGASGVARRAGESAGTPGGYAVSTMQGKSRYRAIVYAETFKAKRREAEGNHLLRGLR
ncbi:hypothetical protein AALF15_01355 [Corynebacteriaceae bacterium 7-707]